MMQIVEQTSGDWTPGLAEKERECLFAIAMDTLNACVSGAEIDLNTYDVTERLSVPMATFVTLKMRGMLRGCIGSLEPVAPLFKSIHDNAIQAALGDPRFPAVSQNDLPALDVHLSILSPIRSIESLDEFHVGEHGIILTKGFARAVYLPEVAVEQGWDKEQTLASLSQKAGLDADAWRHDAGFNVFSSVVLEQRNT
jgi:AmmeMemoRadiSam system protein A